MPRAAEPTLATIADMPVPSARTTLAVSVTSVHLHNAVTNIAVDLTNAGRGRVGHSHRCSQQPCRDQYLIPSHAVLLLLPVPTNATRSSGTRVTWRPISPRIQQRGQTADPSQGVNFCRPVRGGAFCLASLRGTRWRWQSVGALLVVVDTEGSQIQTRMHYGGEGTSPPPVNTSTLSRRGKDGAEEFRYGIRAPSGFVAILSRTRADIAECASFSGSCTANGSLA